ESSGSGALVWTGTVTNNSTLATKILNLGGTNADANEIQGVLADNTGGGSVLRVDKENAGNWILSADNTYTGATNINNGTLQIGNGGTTGSLAIASTITNNGALVFNRSDDIAQGTDFSASPITGSGSVTQSGSGTLVLSATNDYDGLTRVNNGVLNLLNNADGSITWGGSFEINNGSRLEIESITNFTNFQNRTFTFDSAGGGTIDFDGNILWRENTIVTTGGAKNTVSGERFNMQNTRTAFYNVADGSDAIDLEVSLRHDRGSIDKSGAGTLALTNVTNNLLDTNTITINAGTLEIAASGRITSGNWGGAITNDGTFDYNSSANQVLSGVIDGTGVLVQNGAGTLTLSGANLYTGTTTVNAGTLLVDGSLSTSSVVDVTGGTLGGVGTVGGNTTINSGATLSAATNGTSGTLAFSGDLTMSSGSTWLVDLTHHLTPGSGGEVDLVNISNALALNSADLQVIESGAFLLGETYQIASYGVSPTLGLFSNGTQVTGSLGGVFEINYADGGNFITLTAVPEPAAFLPLLLLLVVGFRIYRRRTAEVA
ncbi:MAG: autotransporter-associated beta strand repeat-containing protein, partial [Verrucomicrobiota bacterium]